MCRNRNEKRTDKRTRDYLISLFLFISSNSLLKHFLTTFPERKMIERAHDFEISYQLKIKTSFKNIEIRIYYGNTKILNYTLLRSCTLKDVIPLKRRIGREKTTS